MLRDDIKYACEVSTRATMLLPAKELPLLDGTIYVRELRGEDLVFIADSKTGLEDRSRWAVRSLSDSAANRVFANEDLDWISGDKGLPTPLLERAYWAARQITGYTEENRRSFLPPSPGIPGGGSPTS